MQQTLLLATLDGLAQASVLFMVAVGLSLIFGIMRILNVAHGSFYALGAYGAVTLGLWLAGPDGGVWTYPALLLAAVAIGVTLGPLVERFLLRRIYGKEHALQLLLTFGVFMILEDVQKMMFGVEPMFNDAPLAMLGMVEVGGIYYTAYQLFVLPLSAIAVMLALTFYFNKTRQGKLIATVIEDYEVARVLGINAKRVYTITFMLGTALAALGGALASPTTSLVPGIGADSIVISFAIVATAGLGHFQGTAVTAVIVGLVQALCVHLLPALSSVVPYLVMTAILLVKPYGLFGKPQVRRI